MLMLVNINITICCDLCHCNKLILPPLVCRKDARKLGCWEAMRIGSYEAERLGGWEAMRLLIAYGL